MSPNGRPRLGLLLGDPSGIGPELCARLLAGGSLAGRADVLVIGRPDIWRDGVRIAGAGLDLPVAQGPDRNGEALAIWDAVPGNEEFPRAQANPLSGE